MDSSAISWLSETGLDNPIFTDQFDFTDSFDEELAAIIGGDHLESCLSPENNSPPSSTNLNNNIPSANSISSFCTSSTTTPIILNFGNAKSSTQNPQNNVNPDEEEAVVSDLLRSQTTELAEEQPKRAENTKRTTRVRPPSQTYDHILAERKRREQLSQHFVALSTIVPGLKKMDKTSILGDAIKYLQCLQERVKTLEEQATRKKSMETAVLVKKSQIMVEDDDDDENPSFEEQPLPEIEARVCNSEILLRILCENQRGLLTNLIGQVEKLNLTIVHTNVTSFGMLALGITIITKMEKEFNLTVNEVVQRLHAAIKRGNGVQG